LTLNGGSPIQRVEDDKKASNKLLMRVNNNNNKVGWFTEAEEAC